MTRAATAAIVVTLAGLGACSSTPSAPGDPYLTDASYRRATLVASLVNPGNEYSRLRLASYDTGQPGDWSRLPEWNPRVDVVAAAELDHGVVGSAPFGTGASELVVADAVLHGDEAALVALGEKAFFRYPVELAPEAESAAASREAFARYGFWTDEARGAGGLVRVELADGNRWLAYTCATCHAATRGGSLIIGLFDDRLDLGKLAFDNGRTNADASRFLSWGPGRLDVTTAEAREPVRIADLRPVKWLSHLQADASVAETSRAALAIRIETLLVTSHAQEVRPPRAIALALAAYVWSLADALPAPDLTTRGAGVFAATCARCHAPPAFTGPPVPLDVVGTDPAIGMSLVRGTGTYRVPSLRGVGARGALFHDASLAGLDELLDPARVEPTYAGGRHGAGAVSGHAFGLDLPNEDRASLLEFLKTL